MDILEEAAAIIDSVGKRHNYLIDVLRSQYALTEAQAGRAIAMYEDNITRAAAILGVSEDRVRRSTPGNIDWMTLGFCAGSVQMHDALHGIEE